MLNRILAIHSSGEINKRWSHAKLFLEHLRRTALWVKILDWPDAPPLVCDLPNRIDSSRRAKPTAIQAITEFAQSQGYIGLPTIIFSLTLHWEALDAQFLSANFDLPNPYEPLIVLYERGGYISKDHGWWEVSSQTFSIKKWDFYVSLPPIDLNPLALDKLDTLKGRAHEPDS